MDLNLPHVSLDDPAPCRRPAPPSDGTAARSDGPGDARSDGPGDGRSDGGRDGGGDGGAGDPLVVTFRPGAPAGPDSGGNLPAVALASPLPAAARAWITVAHWAGGWWRSLLAAAANPRGPYHAQPESLAAHDAYRRSRAWVPPGHEGRFLGPAGGAYHLTFARFGMVTGYLWAWIWARPARLFLTLAVLGVVLGFWLG